MYIFIMNIAFLSMTPARVRMSCLLYNAEVQLI